MDTDCKCAECLGTFIEGERTEDEQSHDSQVNNHANELQSENTQFDPPIRTPDYVPPWYTDEEESESEDNTQLNGNTQTIVDNREAAESDQLESSKNEMQVVDGLQLEPDNTGTQTIQSTTNEQMEEFDESQLFIPRRSSPVAPKRKFQETQSSSYNEYDHSDSSNDETEQDINSSDSETKQPKRQNIARKRKTMKRNDLNTNETSESKFKHNAQGKSSNDKILNSHPSKSKQSKRLSIENSGLEAKTITVV